MFEKEEKEKLINFLENDFQMSKAIELAVKEWSPGTEVTVWANSKGELRTTLDSGNTSYETEDIGVYSLDSNFWNNQSLEITSVFSDEDYFKFKKWCKKNGLDVVEEYNNYEILQKYAKESNWSWEEMLSNFLETYIDEAEEELNDKIKVLKEGISQM